MAGYTKLFNSILASTIWEADMPTRIVWITLLAMADKHGICEGSVPGLATFARVSLPQCRAALKALQEPDPDSRSHEQDGRRIEVVEGGWRLINHGKYRAKLGEDERREYLRVKQAEHRARKQASTKVNTVSDKSTQSTHAEAEADTEAIDQDQKQRVSRATHKQLLRLAHEVIDLAPNAEPSEVKDSLKARCSVLGLSYDSGSITRALDAVEYSRSAR